MPLGHLPSHGLTFKSAPSTDPSVVVLSRIAVIGISVPPGVVSGGTGISTGVDFIVFQKKVIIPHLLWRVLPPQVTEEKVSFRVFER